MSKYTPVLRDADTDELIGEATWDQHLASDIAYGKNQHGIILIDADGDVIDPSAMQSARQPVRRVYTEAIG